jgi:polar amino acid transport system substrate-binding protein
MKKSKFLTLLLAVIMIVPLMLASCNDDTKNTSSAASSQTTSQSALAVPESIKKAGQIIMATNASFPPYEYMDDNGKYAGIDVEMMQAIADLWGVKLVINNMEFDSILAAIQTGKADFGVAGMTVNEERLKSVSFSYTYTKAKQVIIVKNDSKIAAVKDLTGKTVGVQTGTTGDIYASDAADKKEIGAVERYKNGIDAVLALTQNKIEAVIIDNEPAKVFVKQNQGIKIIDESYTDEEYAIAMAKDNTELKNAINAALETLDKNGKLKLIIDKFIKA